eukprot:TRINITY_DN2617_c0_g1_i1.p1 TRINITY_DN2617_c0_g1~~TRINITY_DN2617_c0_g1_i1.p1  ORF type:complete len:190 (+),score=34.16 TRINITY_DN2617_c0_g1_i1:249-818(+)
MSLPIEIEELIGAAVRALGDTILPVGVILLFAGTETTPPPSGFLFCKGQQVSRTTYSNLFSAITTIYGPGDGVNTFNLPNLCGRVPVGAGTGPGLQPRTVLTIDEIPSHSHEGTTGPGNSMEYTIMDPLYTTGGVKWAENYGTGWHEGLEKTSEDALYPLANHTHDFTTKTTGGGEGHNNMQPYVVLNF